MPDTVPAQLSWSLFPFCQDATMTSRGSSSHGKIFNGVLFRHYGVNVHEYMLLGWNHKRADRVAPVLRDLAAFGNKVKSVNFTLPVPPGITAQRGPTEWRIHGDWSDPRGGQGKTAQTMRRACRGLAAVPVNIRLDGPPAKELLACWASWAQERHFMVFKGVYRRWLELYFEEPIHTDQRCPWLYKIIHESGRMIGLFGGETDVATGEAVVTLAKHIPELGGSALWVLGLTAMMRDIGALMVHCGADADELKRNLGFIPHPSWVPDLRRLS